MENTLTALNLAIANGAVPEVDLMQTADGHFVTGHPTTKEFFSAKLGKREMRLPDLAEYLQENPEALTLDELADWISHQDEHSKVYIELKSKIAVQNFIDAAKKAVNSDDESKINSVLNKLILYSGDKSLVGELLGQKQTTNLKEENLPVVYLTDGLVTKATVDQMVELKEKHGQGVFAIEQGMFAWTKPGFRSFFESFTGKSNNIFNTLRKGLRAYRFRSAEDKKAAMALEQLPDVIKYAGEVDKNIKIIVGTNNNPAMIRYLVEAGVYGIVPDNAVDFEIAGIKRPVYEAKPKLKFYLPESMQQRIKLVPALKGQPIPQEASSVQVA